MWRLVPSRPLVGAVLTRSQAIPCTSILYRKFATENTSPSSTLTSNKKEKSPNQKNTLTNTRTGKTIEEKIAELQAEAEQRKGVYDIETPKLYPPPQGGVSGSRRRKRLQVRVYQRLSDHKKLKHQRPTTNAASVNSRHLSLPPTEPKPKFPSVIIPRLPQIEYEKLESANVKKA